MNYKYTSRSEEDTLNLAENLESEKFPGMLICLSGELGSGKTVFVKGFAKALGITETITSPTFALIKEWAMFAMYICWTLNCIYGWWEWSYNEKKKVN